MLDEEEVAQQRAGKARQRELEAGEKSMKSESLTMVEMGEAKNQKKARAKAKTR